MRMRLNFCKGSAVPFVLCGNSEFLFASRTQTEVAKIELRKPNCNESQSLGKWL